MAAPKEILDLIERFERNIDAYKTGQYNETQLRREFLDPFFKQLGWDIDNTAGYAEPYKDVIHEDQIRLAGAAKAPDYSFRIGGARKFFLEAKKPSIYIKGDPSPAFQLRRYAWTEKLPLSILSDFEEFAVYDGRFKPVNGDDASKARVFYCTFKEYPEKWDWIASIFSRDAILKGSFDKYAEQNKSKRGTTDVDEDFLATIESWRKDLAQNLALRNPSLTQRELNFAVQRIIDRIIFLRICEDRAIEDYGRLRALTNGERIYPRLCELFEEADTRYNSGLFHFKKEKDRHEAPDELTLNLDIDDKLLRNILRPLYYPDSPYAFSHFPADILGQVYEQFLGKIIRLTPAHRAEIDDKPEVKKAGGVYYTPTYIVKYIVEQTVGKLLENKTPKQAAALRILDPACGSGSFLIGAYQHLLDWHLNWYTQNDPVKYAKGSKPALVQAAGGAWKLTIDERKRILLNNIYGVDIDSQAVETTKLSLLLKVLEGETNQTLQPVLRIFHERALPDLGNNIKCGNSLIGLDFYDQPDLPLLSEEDRYRINVFDWKIEFPGVFTTAATDNSNGFDAIIGNPPYLRIQGLQKSYTAQIEYFASRYVSAVKRFDLYLLFIERALSLTRGGGRVGFICPHKFVNSDFGSGLRGLLVQTKALEAFIAFGNNLIFRTASTYTAIVLLSKIKRSTFHFASIPDTGGDSMAEHLNSLSTAAFTAVPYSQLTHNPWTLSDSVTRSLLNKLQLQPTKVQDVFESVFQGIVTGADDLYFLRPIKELGSTFRVQVPRDDRIIEIEKGILRPLLKGEDVSRYSAPKPHNLCLYPYKLLANKTVILEEHEFAQEFPLAFAFLSEYRTELRDLRIKYKTNPKYWYSCHRGRSIAAFARERIISQEISLGCNMTIDRGDFYHNTTVYSFLPSHSAKEDLKFWLGILNSKIMWWFLTQTGNVLRGGYFRFKTEYLNPFPIPRVDFSAGTSVSAHDRLIKLVAHMLDLVTSASPRTPQERSSLERQIAATNAQIDRLVYELYGLTEDEIKIVEQATA